MIGFDFGIMSVAVRQSGASAVNIRGNVFSLGNGWSDSGGGVFVRTGPQAGSSDLFFDLEAQSGNRLRVTFKLDIRNDGFVRYRFGSQTGGFKSGTTTYVEEVDVTDNGRFGLQANNTFDGQVSNIIVESV